MPNYGAITHLLDPRMGLVACLYSPVRGSSRAHRRCSRQYCGTGSTSASIPSELDVTAALLVLQNGGTSAVRASNCLQRRRR